MFQLLRYKEDPVTHKIDAMVEYEWIGGEYKRIEKAFDNDVIAKSWVDSERKKYGISKLRNYILHKKTMSEVSSQWATPENRAAKLRSLEIMLREMEIIATCDLWMIAKFIQRCYPHLVKILPAEHHITYLKQKQIVQQLWEYACEIIPNSGEKQTTITD